MSTESHGLSCPPPLSRRRLMQTAGALGVVVACAGRGPAMAAPPAPAAPSALRPVDEAQASLIGGREVRPGLLRLQAPAIAENGATVPIVVDLAQSLPAGTVSTGIAVQAIHLLSEANPVPLIASFFFSPRAVPFVSTRIRLAESQSIRVLAQLSDGSVYGLRQEIKVTIGGCGG